MIMRSTAIKMALIGLILISPIGISKKARAGTEDWQRGASIYPTEQLDFSSPEFRESLRNLKKTGANYVSLVIPYHQKNKYSSEILSGPDTPSDKVLTDAIEYAHSIDLKVMLKPHLATGDGDWRAFINADDRKAWFASYGDMLDHLADIAEKTHAEEMCIGTELISMSTYTSNAQNKDYWINMINNVRAHYSGLLTYSANWGGSDFSEEVSHINFWPYLDFIGISAYYSLAKEIKNPILPDFDKAWEYWDTHDILPLYQKYNKPILFTEVGYRSVADANIDPYDGTRNGLIDLDIEAKLYESLLEYWNAKPYFAGMQFWNWDIDPLEGGPGDNHYTPRFKPAEEVIKKWWQNQEIKPENKQENKLEIKDIKNNTENNSISSAYSNHADYKIGEDIIVDLPSGNVFKPKQYLIQARLQGHLNNKYVMSWSSDGGQEIWMKDSTRGNGKTYEESMVDFSEWTWRGNSPYYITFTSREFSGKILARKTIEIHIATST
jgi:hypothetical protein